MRISKSEQIALIAKLPLLSARVYSALLNGLYAEPGFSDVTADDIGLAIGEPMRNGKVAGALGTLVEKRLVYVDECEVNGRTLRLLHAECRVDDDNDWRDEAITLVSERLAKLGLKENPFGPAQKRQNPTKKSRRAPKRQVVYTRADAEREKRDSEPLYDGGLREQTDAKNAAKARVQNKRAKKAKGESNDGPQALRDLLSFGPSRKMPGTKQPSVPAKQPVEVLKDELVYMKCGTCHRPIDACVCGLKQATPAIRSI